jgi:hypothetical protein
MQASLLFLLTPFIPDKRASGSSGAIILGLCPTHAVSSQAYCSKDNYLGDPPEGFKRNSFQFRAGVNYSLKL